MKAEKPETVDAMKWPPIDPTTIAPCKSKNGKQDPDFYNHLATRFVSREESLARGWSGYFVGAPCRNGHVAPRYVSNPALCMGCLRAKRGQAPVYASSTVMPVHYAPRKPAAAAPGLVVAAPAAPEPDKTDQKFLTALAETRNHAKAAEAVGTTLASVETRRACNSTFAKAIEAIEERLRISAPPLPKTAAFKWSAEKRQTFLQVWVDTGDIELARNAVGATPSAYWNELETNDDFAEAAKVAEGKAFRVLESKAISLAAQGNDRLLVKIMTSRLPEYRERVAVNLKLNEQLSDDELNAKITRFLGRVSGRIIDADFKEAEPPPAKWLLVQQLNRLHRQLMQMHTQRLYRPKMLTRLRPAINEQAALDGKRSSI